MLTDLINKDYSNYHIAAIIDEYIHSERDRAILKRRLIDGTPYDIIGVEYGLTGKQISRIIYKHLTKVVKYI